MNAFLLICRVLHIAATCTSIGGLFYARMVLWPTLDRLPEAERGPFLQAMIRRYAGFKWAGVTVVSVTGVVQWVWIWPTIPAGLGTTYLAAFALKMIGALALVSVTALLAIPAAATQGMQSRRGFWSALNLISALLILLGAALMRFVRLGMWG